MPLVSLNERRDIAGKARLRIPLSAVSCFTFGISPDGETYGESFFPPWDSSVYPARVGGSWYVPMFEAAHVRFSVGSGTLWGISVNNIRVRFQKPSPNWPPSWTAIGDVTITVGGSSKEWLNAILATGLADQDISQVFDPVTQAQTIFYGVWMNQVVDFDCELLGQIILMASIDEDISRETYTGGPEPGEWGETSGPSPNRRDLRGYTSARLDWWTISNSNQKAEARLLCSSGGFLYPFSHTGNDFTAEPASRMTVDFAGQGTNFYGADIKTEIDNLDWFGSPRFKAHSADVEDKARAEIEGDAGEFILRNNTHDRGMFVTLALGAADEAKVEFRGHNRSNEAVPAGQVTIKPIHGPKENEHDDRYAVAMKYWHSDAVFPDIEEIAVPAEWSSGLARDYEVEVRFGNPPNTQLLGHWQEQPADRKAIGFVYDSESLDGAGLNKYAWRCSLFLPAEVARWQALQVSSAAREVLAMTEGIAGWLPGGDAVLSHSSAALKIAGPSGKWAEREITANAFQANKGRFLAVTAWADGEAPLKILIGQKYWIRTLTSNPASQVVDLCSPDNLEDSDLSNTRYEREFAGGQESRSQGGWGWGVDSPFTIRFEVLSASDVFVASILAPSIEGPGSVWMAEEVENIPDRRVKDTPEQHEVYARRGIVHMSAGRVAIDQPYGYVTVDPLEGDIPSRRTIEDLVSEYEALGPGVTRLSTPDGSIPGPEPLPGGTGYLLPKGFFGKLRPAYHLVPEERRGSQPAVLAHYQVDRIEFGMGTTWRADGSPRIIEHLRVFGGGIHGLVCDPVDGPAVDVDIDLLVNQLVEDETRSVSLGVFRLPDETVNSCWPVERNHNYEVVPQDESDRKAELTRLFDGATNRACMAVVVTDRCDCDTDGSLMLPLCETDNDNALWCDADDGRLIYR